MPSCPGRTAEQTLQPLRAAATADVLVSLGMDAATPTSLMLHRSLTPLTCKMNVKGASKLFTDVCKLTLMRTGEL